MRHVIIGGSGFTGTALCEALLKRGQTPLVLDLRPPPKHLTPLVDFLQGDTTDSRALASLRLAPDDAVYQLAARQFHGPVPTRGRQAWFDAVNVLGVRNTLSAMAQSGASMLVFFSTDMTYGMPQQNPVPSTHSQTPLGHYGRSKLAAERLLLDAVRSGKLHATIFRPRLIAGAGRLGILTKLFSLIRLGAPVPMIGTGKNRYQLVAVEDCVQAALTAVEKGCPTGPFNLGSANPPNVKSLLGSLISRAGSRSRLLATPAPLVQFTLAALDAAGLTLLYPEQFAIADTDFILDTSQTVKELGWTPAAKDEDVLWDAYTHFCATA
jgi:dTDP-glucose 4,6-dehydratase